MTFVISGASSSIAGLVLDELAGTIAPEQIVLVTRNPARLRDRQDRGYRLVEGDPSDPASLTRAYEGASRLLLISGLNVGSRVADHRNGIEAAKAVGIEHLIYTSVAGAHPTNPTPSAREHFQTELDLYDSGLSFAALRNQYYLEAWVPTIRNVAAFGKGTFRMVGEHGLVAPISTRDIARSAARIMLAPERHDRVVYELTGPQQLTYPQIVALYSQIFEPVEYCPITQEQYYDILGQRGWPRHFDPSFPAPVCFGMEETVQQMVANEAGYQNVLTGSVEFITGQKPRLAQEVFTEIRARQDDGRA